MLKNHRNKIIFFSINVMLYSAIINTDTGIISQFTHQNGNDWVGPLLTGLFFLGSGLCSTINFYIGKYQYRYCIFFGSIGSLVYILLGIIFIKIPFTTFSLILILVSSFVGGCLVSVFYNSIYNYINLLSQQDNQETKYFCISIGIINCSNLIGSILSSLLIVSLNQFQYSLTLACLILMVSCCFLLFRHKKNYIRQNSQVSNREQSILSPNTNQISEYIGLNNQNQEEPIDYFHKNKYSGYLLIPLYGITGMIIAYIFTGFSIIIYLTFQNMQQKDLNQLTFFLFLFEGFGEVIGGISVIIISFYNQKLSKNPQTKSKVISPEFVLKIIIGIFCVAIGFIFFATHNKNKILFGLGIFLVGFTDCTAVSMCLSICSRWKKYGVSTYNFSQCFLVFINNCFMGFVNTSLISLVAFIYMLIAAVNIQIYHRKYKRYLNQKVQ